jgi:Transglutaminase-like superfamily
MRRRLRALLSLAVIVRAAVRVGFHHQRRDLPELVERLRTTPRGCYCDPKLDRAVLERLLPFLPPFGMGPCVKRSLFLLDLWSRAGLAPSFHAGVRGSAGSRSGHAWIRTKEGAFATYQPPDVVEALHV